MELIDVLRRRRMVRDFAELPLGDDQLAALADAGVRAPSAGYAQGVSLLTLTGGRVSRFWAATAGDHASVWLTGMRRAPALIMVWTSEDSYRRRYAEPDKGRDPGADWPVPWWWVDAGAVIENILLRAVDLGLGAGLFGLPAGAEQAVRAEFGVPADQQAVAAIAIGHRAAGERPRGSATRRDRRPDAVHVDRW
ncbi:nitroreductase family protein [Naumannella cuiyingiana]|nr:nitroreductase family protein [Naumannella cuiyingiana]